MKGSWHPIMGFVFIDIMNHGVVCACVYSDEKNFAFYHNNDIAKIRVCHVEGDGVLEKLPTECFKLL